MYLVDFIGFIVGGVIVYKIIRNFLGNLPIIHSEYIQNTFSIQEVDMARITPTKLCRMFEISSAAKRKCKKDKEVIKLAVEMNKKCGKAVDQKQCVFSNLPEKKPITTKDNPFPFKMNSTLSLIDQTHRTFSKPEEMGPHVCPSNPRKVSVDFGNHHAIIEVSFPFIYFSILHKE